MDRGIRASDYLRQARTEIFLVPGGGSAYPGKELPKRRQPGRWSRRTDAITQPWNGVLWPCLARQRQFHAVPPGPHFPGVRWEQITCEELPFPCGPVARSCVELHLASTLVFTLSWMNPFLPFVVTVDGSGKLKSVRVCVCQIYTLLLVSGETCRC